MTSVALTLRPFQLGYLTKEMAAGIATMRREQGVELADLGVLDFEGPDGRIEIGVALGYAGDMMVEIIQPVSGNTSVYTPSVPDVAGPVCLHHLGYEVESDEEFDAVIAAHQKLGHEIVFSTMHPAARFAYVDTRGSLGHVQEYILWQEAGLELLNTLPRLR